jgi:hypothetical protein
MMWRWKTYMGQIKIKEGSDLKTYGLVRKKDGRILIRNYKRPLKKGTGLSVIDLIELKMRHFQGGVIESLRRMVLPYLVAVLVILISGCTIYPFGLRNDQPSNRYALATSDNACYIDALLKRQEIRLRDAGVWTKVLFCSWEEDGYRFSHAFLVFEDNGTLWTYDREGSSDTRLRREELTNLSGLAFVSLMARGKVIRTEIKAYYQK